MARLIDAEELDKLIVKSFHMTEQEYVRAGYSIVRILMDKCPTVDAEPVRHGQWMRVVDNRGVHCVCPYCGEWEYHQGQKYCGECGAKMDEVAET